MGQNWDSCEKTPVKENNQTHRPPIHKSNKKNCSDFISEHQPEKRNLYASQLKFDICSWKRIPIGWCRYNSPHNSPINLWLDMCNIFYFMTTFVRGVRFLIQRMWNTQKFRPKIYLFIRFASIDSAFCMWNNAHILIWTHLANTKIFILIWWILCFLTAK